MKIMWKPCHACDFAEVERIPRRFWMRVLPRLRHYHCDRCASDFLAPKDVVESRQWLIVAFRNVPVATPAHAETTDTAAP
jgi:hypothetical protein